MVKPEPQDQKEPRRESWEFPKPIVEQATLVSSRHPDRNEDKILGVADEKLPVLAGEDPEGDRAALKESIEKEARYAETLKELGVSGVLDGVSTGAGALASRMSSAEIAERLAALKEIEDADPYMKTDRKVQMTERAVREALAAAQKAVMDYKNDPGRSLMRDDLKGMGTTADIVRVVDDKAVIGHIGDGAVYLMRDGELQRLTKDQSLAGYMREKYGVSEREYEILKESDEERPEWTDGMKEVFKSKGQFKMFDRSVYASIGNDSEDSKAQVLTVDLRPGDRMMICSDGVVDNWKWDDLQEALAQGMTAQEFMQATLDRQTKIDDISFEMIEYAAADEAFLEMKEEGAEVTPEVVSSLREQTEESGRKLATLKGDIESDDPDRLAVHGGREAALGKWQAATREYLNRKKLYLESAVDLAGRATGLDMKNDGAEASSMIAQSAADAYMWTEVARMAEMGAGPEQSKGQISDRAARKYSELLNQGLPFEAIAAQAMDNSVRSQDRVTATENLLKASRQLELTRQQMTDFENAIDAMNKGRIEGAREDIEELDESDLMEMDEDDTRDAA